jgi:hypothetical protein
MEGHQDRSHSPSVLLRTRLIALEQLPHVICNELAMNPGSPQLNNFELPHIDVESVCVIGLVTWSIRRTQKIQDTRLLTMDVRV